MNALSSERQTILLLALGLSAFLLITGLFPDLGKTKTTRAISAGKTIDVTLTLVTADSTDLACAGNDVVAGARCAFDKDGQPSGQGSNVLAPYMTLDNVLFLIPDLWSEPALAKKLREDPPSVKRDLLRRFSTKCKLKVEEKAKSFYVRWTPTAEWSHRPDAWVGRISDCKID